jgi:hypothetical protein
MPCSLVDTYQRFGEASFIRHEGRRHPVGFSCTLVSHKGRAYGKCSELMGNVHMGSKVVRSDGLG